MSLLQRNNLDFFTREVKLLNNNIEKQLNYSGRNIITFKTKNSIQNYFIHKYKTNSIYLVVINPIARLPLVNTNITQLHMWVHTINRAIYVAQHPDICLQNHQRNQVSMSSTNPHGLQTSSTSPIAQKLFVYVSASRKDKEATKFCLEQFYNVFSFMSCASSQTVDLECRIPQQLMQ